MHRIFIQVHRVNECFTLILITVMKFIFLNLMRRSALFILFAALGMTLLPAQNVVTMQNAGFESWQEDLPVSWFGSSSSISKSSVFISSEAYAGIYSCRLLRTQKTHVRFSSESISLTTGNYLLSYYVKGNGCIRNSFYNGTSYAAYSDYDTLAQNTWKQVEYAFEVKKDANVQLLFSLCQTDTIGLFIDEVQLKSVLSSVTRPMEDMAQIWTSSNGLEIDLLYAREVRIFNTIGQLLYKKVLSSGLNMLPFPSGCYIVRFEEDDFCQKVIVP